MVEMARRAVRRGYLVVSSRYCLGFTILFCERVTIGWEWGGSGSVGKASADGVDDAVGDSVSEEDENKGECVGEENECRGEDSFDTDATGEEDKWEAVVSGGSPCDVIPWSEGGAKKVGQDWSFEEINKSKIVDDTVRGFSVGTEDGVDDENGNKVS